MRVALRAPTQNSHELREEQGERDLHNFDENISIPQDASVLAGEICGSERDTLMNTYNTRQTRAHLDCCLLAAELSSAPT